LKKTRAKGNGESVPRWSHIQENLIGCSRQVKENQKREQTQGNGIMMLMFPVMKCTWLSRTIAIYPLAPDTVHLMKVSSRAGLSSMEEIYENIIEASCFLSAWRRCSNSLLKVQRKCHVGRKRYHVVLLWSRAKPLCPLTALLMIADLASLCLRGRVVGRCFEEERGVGCLCNVSRIPTQAAWNLCANPYPVSNPTSNRHYYRW
jgi:hypothetical protein